MESNTRRAMRKVDLSEQITRRILHGFPISPEDYCEAEALGIDVRAMELALGVDDGNREDEDYE